MDEFPGQCLCGAVRFVARAPSLFCGHCHCRFCRQAHGAAFVTWVGFPGDSVRIESGAEDVRWYQSSKESRRASCRLCGAMMLYESTCVPGETHVARASMPGSIDREPEFHTFFDQRVEWVSLGDDLPKLTSDSPLLSMFQNVGR
jgi:hypothetical protein